MYQLNIDNKQIIEFTNLEGVVKELFIFTDYETINSADDLISLILGEEIETDLGRVKLIPLHKEKHKEESIKQLETLIEKIRVYIYWEIDDFEEGMYTIYELESAIKKLRKFDFL